VGSWVDEVIGDQMVMMVMANEGEPVEVIQDEKPREEKPGVPERVGNPSIEVIVIPGGWVVGDHRWTFFIVIVVYYRGIRLGLVFSVLTATTWNDSQTEFSCHILKRLQRLLLPHR